MVAKSVLLVMPALMLSVAFARRASSSVDLNIEKDTADVSAANGDTSDDSLEAFRKDIAPICADCALVMSTLIEGITNAGFLKSISWNHPTLEATLMKETLYGMIPYKSKIDDSWVLQSPLRFTVNQSSEVTKVLVEGMKTTVPAKQTETYKAVLEEAGLPKDCGTSTVNKECYTNERNAALSYLKKHWSSMKYAEDRGSKGMQLIYGNMAAYMAVKAFKGDEAFGDIFWSGLTNFDSNRVVRSFSFSSGKVIAENEPDQLHPANRFAEEYRIPEKRKIAEAVQEEEIGDMSAPNYVEMFQAGSAKEAKDPLKSGGKASVLAKLFVLCTEGEDQCTGKKPGRVMWQLTPVQ